MPRHWRRIGNRSLLGVTEIAGHEYAAAPNPFAQTLELAFDAATREYVPQQNKAHRETQDSTRT